MDSHRRSCSTARAADDCETSTAVKVGRVAEVAVAVVADIPALRAVLLEHTWGTATEVLIRGIRLV
jgi:hypothetical protein